MAAGSTVLYTDNKTDIDIYQDDIDMYLQEYIESRGLDRDKIPSPQWAAAMIFICDHTFRRDNSCLLAKNAPIDCANDYDLLAVKALCDRYVFLCNDYNQRVCIEHFCYLSGICPDTIYRWAKDTRAIYIYDKAFKGVLGDRVTIRRSDIYQSLINSIIGNADDIMLSRSGVNSIAYKNGVIERYGTGAGRASDSADFADMAAQLGITDALGLPGD